MVSLVEFLDERGVDSSFDSRDILWQQFKPNEKYTGTAAQNLALLEQLQQDEIVPKLELTANIFDVGDLVRARVVSSATVGIETYLGSRSFAAEPDEIVDLGTVREIGSFPIRITNNLLFREGILLLFPQSDGKLTATIIATPRKDETPPEPIELTEGDFEIIGKYYRGLTKDILRESFEEVFTKDWVAGNIVQLSSTVLLCGLSFGTTCFWGASAFAVSITFDALKIAADKVATSGNSGLSPAEAERIKAIFTNSNIGIQILAPIDFKNKASRVCSLVSAVSAGLDSIVAEAEQKDDNDRAFVLSARVFLQQSGKLTGIICINKK